MIQFECPCANFSRLKLNMQEEFSALKQETFRVLNTMSTLETRLREVMKELNLEQDKDMADFCGVSAGLVSQWWKGSTKLGPKPLMALSKTKFNLDWITTGKGPKYRQSEESQISAKTAIEMLPGAKRVAIADPEDPQLVQIRRVRLRLQAGINGFQVDSEPESGIAIFFTKEWMQERGYFPEDLIAVKVRGNSMDPTVTDGATVVINTADKAPRDGKVYAFNYEGECVIKRLVRDIGEWFIASDNPDQRQYPRKRLRGAECIPIGRVVHRQMEDI